jgi:hypothetical protein
MISQGLDDLLQGRVHPTMVDGHRALRVIALAMRSHMERRPLAWHETAAVDDLVFQFT